MNKKEKLYPLFWLLNVGGVCYKKDFYLLIPSIKHKTEIYKYFLNSGYIIEYEMTQEDRKKCVADTATIVALTADQALRSRLSNELDFPGFKKKTTPVIEKRLIPSNGKKKSSYLRDRMFPKLNAASVMIMMHLAGVRVAPSEKPSLEFLNKYINYANSNLLASNKNKAIIHGYLDKQLEKQCSVTENGKIKVDYVKLSRLCRTYINHGLYYTKEEFRRYDANVHNKSASDSYKNAKFEGIFFNKGTCLVVSILASSQNSRLKLYKSSLTNLNEKIEELIIEPFAKQINRNIAGVDNIFSNTNTSFKHGINSLLISISNTMVPTMVLGAKRGVLSRNEKNLSKNRNSSDKIATEFLDANTSFYGLIFVAVKNELGIKQIKYITTHSIESWRAESSKLLSLCNRNSSTGDIFNQIVDPGNKKSVSFYPGMHIDTAYDCLFLPVYEVKLLARLHEVANTRDTNLLVLTESNMNDYISHSIRIGNTESQDAKELSYKTNLMFLSIRLRDAFKPQWARISPVNELDDDQGSSDNTYSFDQYSSIKLSDVQYELDYYLDKNENKIIKGAVSYDEFFIYNKFGKIDGKEIIDNYLAKEKNKVANYDKISKSDQIRLFNSISRGTISLDEAVSNIGDLGGTFNEAKDPKNTKKQAKKVNSIKDYRGIYFNLKKSDYEYLENKAKKENMPISAYVKEMILKNIKK